MRDVRDAERRQTANAFDEENGLCEPRRHAVAGRADARKHYSPSLVLIVKEGRVEQHLRRGHADLGLDTIAMHTWLHRCTRSQEP